MAGQGSAPKNDIRERAIQFALDSLGPTVLASLRGEIKDGELIAASMAGDIAGDLPKIEAAIRDAESGDPIAIDALRMVARLETDNLPPILESYLLQSALAPIAPQKRRRGTQAIKIDDDYLEGWIAFCVAQVSREFGIVEIDPRPPKGRHTRHIDAVGIVADALAHNAENKELKLGRKLQKNRTSRTFVLKCVSSRDSNIESSLDT